MAQRREDYGPRVRTHALKSLLRSYDHLTWRDQVRQAHTMAMGSGAGDADDVEAADYEQELDQGMVSEELSWHADWRHHAGYDLFTAVCCACMAHGIIAALATACVSIANIPASLDCVITPGL